MATKYLSIDAVVGRTKWSDGLKKSMIQDFVKSGYGNVALLIGADAKETSKNIQNKVRDFSSGKNTYLQANQLAEIIHSMGSGTPRRYYKRKVQTDASQDGDVLKDCSGWTITKKNLEDGRIVYNANIKAETPKNKGDWAAIKGDVYVETTFKWNFKFQKFERWGQIENESEIIEKLCQVLGKYYEGGEKPAPAPQSTTLKEGDKFKMYGRVYEINRILEGRVFYNPVDDEMAERDVTISEAEKEIANKVWVKIEDEEEETPAPESEDESLDILIDGEFIEKVASEHDAFVLLVNNFGEDKLKKMRDNHQVFNDRANKKLYVFRNEFVYGKNWGVPKFYGNDLQLEFAERGYKVFVSAKPKANILVIYKKGMAIDGVIINDNGGEFNLVRYGYNETIDTINYIIDDKAVSVPTLASIINDIAVMFYEGKQEEAPETPTPEAPKSKEENSIPANPKLDYCRINWAEGFAEYADKFPKDFSSFTELTKYIAKNIKELPNKGYDKHGVEWKWKFEEQEHTDRWDVSESEANPFRYPNLYASEVMQTLCYMAWSNETDEVTTFEENDDFNAEMLGKEGLELNDEQFNAILKLYLTLYKQDTKRFKYNTPEERIERFKEVYPKTYKLFNSGGQAKSKEDIEKAIKGLQFLADKGNEKAKKAIIGLKILLNK